MRTPRRPLVRACSSFCEALGRRSAKHKVLRTDLVNWHQQKRAELVPLHGEHAPTVDELATELRWMIEDVCENWKSADEAIVRS